MIYTVQDRYEGRSSYIASAPTRQMAKALAEEFEIQDREMNQYEPARYIIKKRELCYADASRTCGHANNCICMLEEPYTQCPARKENTMENKKQKKGIRMRSYTDLSDEDIKALEKSLYIRPAPNEADMRRNGHRLHLMELYKGEALSGSKDVQKEKHPEREQGTDP